MLRPNRRTVLKSISATLALGTVTSASTGIGTAQQGEGWRQVGRDAGNTGYNPGATIPTDSVEQRWTFETESPTRIRSPIVAGSNVYVPNGNTLLALGVTGGGVRWSYESDSELIAPAVGDDQVYAANRDTVIALDTVGNENWTFSTDAVIVSPLAVSDGIVYCADARTTYAIDATDGTEKWRYSASFNDGPAVGEDSIWISGNNMSGVLFNRTLDELNEGAWRENGTPRGEIGGRFVIEYSTISTGQRPPTIDGTTMYIPGFMMAVNTDSGDILWQDIEVGDDGSVVFEDSAVGSVTASPAVRENRLYVGSGDTTGTLPPEIEDNVGTVYALNKGNGSIEWEYETDGPINQSPAVTDDGVCVASEDGTLYALDPDSGSLLWEASIGPVHSAPAVAGEFVFIWTEDDGLVAFGEPQADASDEDSAGDGGSEDDSSSDGSSGSDGDTGSGDGTGSSDGSDPDGSGPGFGVAGALSGIGGTLYIKRHLDDNQE